MTTTSQSRAEPTSVCNNAREGLHETRDRLLKEAGADLELLQKLNTLFCPGRAIRETLTETVVKNILGCICEDCKVTAGYLPEDCRPEIGTCVDIITRDHELAGSAGRLFALLLSIGRPRLILSFIFRKKDDAILREDDLQDTTLETNYWPGVRTGKVHATSDAIARTIVNDFQNNRYQFSPLVLDVKDYITLDKREVLPIIPLRVILGGLRGSVIAFKLYPDYQTLVPDKNAHFARKQIEIEYSELTEADRRTAAEAERDNLDKVSRLEHPHIIDVLKTYRHGSMLNFVFPLAKGNLWEFLRGQKDFEKPLTHTVSPNPGSASSAKNLLESKIWEDMIGIADALHHILTECKDDSYSYLGRHCDLKPANILVHNGTLKITDFGQAQFKIKTDRGSSRITGHSGDQTYLPPEYELGKFPIVYDVWSLGCILLEVLVYALEGPPGVRQLDKLRIENCNTNYFYEHDSDDGGKLRQKSGVREKIHGLKQRASKFRNSQEESFIYNTIDTVNSTIETDFKVRLEADKVRDKLRTDLYIARHATVPRPATPEPPKGQLLVQSFPDVMTAHDGHQRERGKSIIHFYESVEPVPEFRMLVCPETSFPRPLDCSRTDLNLRFIPDYAFKGKAQNDDTQSENLEVEYCISFERTIRLSVYFATIEQARQFQKCLIQQEILVSVFASVQYVEHPIPATERVRDAFRKIGPTPRKNHNPYGRGESSVGSLVSVPGDNTTTKSTESSTNPGSLRDLGALRRVELWKEAGPEDEGTGIPLKRRRLVIFYDKWFTVIHLEDRAGDKYLQRNKVEQNMQFKLYVKRNSSLRGYIMHPDDNPQVPLRAGIRPGGEAFAKQEQDLGYPVRYTSITFGFENIEDLKLFDDQYNKIVKLFVKKRWKE